MCLLENSFDYVQYWRLFPVMGMNPYLVLLALGLLVYYGVESKVQRVVKRRCFREGYNETIYDYSLRDLISNTTVPLSVYRGKVVLIVNVATF